MIDTLYKDEILDHYQDPHNFGKLETYDASSRQVNPFCGDEIEMYLAFEKEHCATISFFGKGCVICLASASLLTDYIKGKTKERIRDMSEQELISLLGITVSETRKKCALLPLAVLKDCV